MIKFVDSCGPPLVINHIGANNIKFKIVSVTKTKAKTRSKYKGLEYDKIQKKWKARIQHDGRKIYLGSFAKEIDAAKAYDEKAKVLFGQFAHLNFPMAL